MMVLIAATMYSTTVCLYVDNLKTIADAHNK